MLHPDFASNNFEPLEFFSCSRVDYQIRKPNY